MKTNPYDWQSRRLSPAPRHSWTPGGRHRAVVPAGRLRTQTALLIAVWWFGIGGLFT